MRFYMRFSFHTYKPSMTLMTLPSFRPSTFFNSAKLSIFTPSSCKEKQVLWQVSSRSIKTWNISCTNSNEDTYTMKNILFLFRLKCHFIELHFSKSLVFFVYKNSIIYNKYTKVLNLILKSVYIYISRKLGSRAIVYW